MTSVTTVNEGVRAVQDLPCYLCGRPGRVAWSHVRDRLYSAPGDWRMLHCRGCELLWLDPQPTTDDLHLLYAGYCTHAGTETQPRWGRLEPWIRAYLARHYGYGSPSRKSWAVWHLVPGVDDLFGGVVNWLPFVTNGRLLDVGCGNGELMRRMRGFGWDVMGVEPDPAAAQVARRQYGLDVRASIHDAPRASFDAVIAHHVIEHVPDPIRFLENVGSVSRPNARIVVVTPNARGLGARWFGASYVHLDPPRHLMLFSAGSLTELARRAGLEVERLTTSARYARFAWSGSRSIAVSRANRGEHDKPGGLRRINSIGFQIAEHMLRMMWRTGGEELVLIARPRPRYAASGSARPSST